MYLKALVTSAPLCCHYQYVSSEPLSEWLLKHWCWIVGCHWQTNVFSQHEQTSNLEEKNSKIFSFLGGPMHVLFSDVFDQSLIRSLFWNRVYGYTKNNGKTMIFSLIFTESAPLGRFSRDVRLCVCLRHRMQFFFRPLIGHWVKKYIYLTFLDPSPPKK